MYISTQLSYIYNSFFIYIYVNTAIVNRCENYWKLVVRNAKNIERCAKLFRKV